MTRPPPLFHGTIKLTADNPDSTICEFDGTCDAAGLGLVLGVAARSHMQNVPAAMREQEFRALLAAFVMSTAVATPLTVHEGSIDVVDMGKGSERLS